MKVEEESEKAGLKLNIVKTKITASSPPISRQIDAPWKESYDKPRRYIKRQRHHFADKGPYNQIYGFSSSHVWM